MEETDKKAPLEGADSVESKIEEKTPEQVEAERIESEKKGQDIFLKLLNGEDIIETVDLGKKGVFKIKYPLSKDYLAIDRQKAILRNNIPPGSFDPTGNTDIEVYATLNVIVVDGPPTWKKCKSILDYPDETLLTELYRRWLRHTREIRELIELVDVRDATVKSESVSESKTVGNGTFPTLAFGPKIDRLE